MIVSAVMALPQQYSDSFANASDAMRRLLPPLTLPFRLDVQSRQCMHVQTATERPVWHAVLPLIHTYYQQQKTLGGKL